MSDEAPGAAPLDVTGTVAAHVTYSADDIKAMEPVEIAASDRGGTTATYTGVPILALLEAAEM